MRCCYITIMKNLSAPSEAYRTFRTKKLSFTYGDSHPTFSGKIMDGKEYRNRLYTYDEIPDIIDRYGLPQIWNPDFKYGPECYIEVQMWTDRGLEPYWGRLCIFRL